MAHPHSPYFSVRLTGERELQGKLKQIEAVERNPLVQRAIINVINEVVVPAIRYETPVGKTRNLIRSIGYLGGYSTRNGVYGKVGARNPQGAAGHLVEFGTGPRWKRSKAKPGRESRGGYCGVMPANRFMHRAISFVRPGLERAMGEEVAVLIEEAAS
jgi:hypothetical protein